VDRLTQAAIFDNLLESNPTLLTKLLMSENIYFKGPNRAFQLRILEREIFRI
jgi:hypothetical protein